MSPEITQEIDEVETALAALILRLTALRKRIYNMPPDKEQQLDAARGVLKQIVKSTDIAALPGLVWLKSSARATLDICEETALRPRATKLDGDKVRAELDKVKAGPPADHQLDALAALFGMRIVRVDGGKLDLSIIDDGLGTDQEMLDLIRHMQTCPCPACTGIRKEPDGVPKTAAEMRAYLKKPRA